MCQLTKLPEGVLVQWAARDGHIDTQALIAGNVNRIDVCAHGYHWAFQYHEKMNLVHYGYTGTCPDAHPEEKPENLKTFENFQQSRQLAAYRYSCEYAADFSRNPERHDLIFTGLTGLGKTHLALAISRVVEARGYRVVFLTATALQRMFTESESWNDDTGSREEARRLRKKILDADLAVIDDLGSDRNTNSELFTQALMELWDARDQRKCWIITTNLSLIGLSERYGQKVCSRLSQYATACQFTGEDYRLSGRTWGKSDGKPQLRLVQ